MRISELARQSGLPVATIKFYLREGLLPAGEPISRTQAEYSDAHLERLRLIRALRDIANLPVATVGTVLAAVDNEELPLLKLLGVTQTAVAGSKGSAPASAEGLKLASELLADLGWRLLAGSPLLDSLARVLDVLHGEGEPVDVDYLRPWADAARAVAEVEMEYIPVEGPRAEAAHRVAVGTVIYGELLAQLRLAAQEAVSLDRFAPGGPPAEKALTEETLSEGTAPEEAPSKDTAPEDTAPEDTAPEDTAPEDTAPEETPSEEAISEEAPSEEAPSEKSLPQ